MLSRYMLIAAGALGIFLGFANPFSLMGSAGSFDSVPFAVLLYPFCLYALAHKSRRYAADTLLAGVMGYGAAFYWIAQTAHVYGLVPYALAVFFPLLLGLYFALYGTFIAYYLHKVRFAPPLCKIVSAGILWYLAEVFRGWFLTGFPWFSLSSAFAPVPSMIQFANAAGAYGLSGIFAVAAFFFAELMLTDREQVHGSAWSVRICRFGGIFILGALYYYGAVTLQNAGHNAENAVQVQSVRTRTLHREADVPYKTVHEIPAIKGLSKHSVLERQNADQVYCTIVQGNISQNVKWSPLFQEDSLKKFFRLSDEAGAFLGEQSIFVYPETAFPVTAYHYRDLYGKISDFSRNKTMLFGIPFYINEGGGKYFNSIELMQDRKKLGEYAKEHLVPFGEYVPPLPLPQFFADMLAKYGGAYSAGINDSPFLTVKADGKTLRFLPLICYEAIFPELTWKKLQGKNGRAAPEVSVLLNVSNDAWYDKTSAPVQHLNLALMRTVESGLPMLRASNTGISAFIDKYGQIVLQSGLFTDETLTVPLSVQPYEPTLFAALAPYLPYLGLALFIFLQMIIVLRRKMEILRSLSGK